MFHNHWPDPFASATKRIFLVAFLALGISIEAAHAETQLPRTLVFGVLNQQSAINTAERWNPLLRYLTAKTGIDLQLKMGPTVNITDAMMGREEFDLVFSNHNFQTEYDGKYRVLVSWAGKGAHCAIVVGEDSPARSLKDLNGLVVAFPSPEAFLAYAVPMVALQEANIKVTAKFAGSQDGALSQLKSRQVHAAAINSRFLPPFLQRENIRVRTIYLSEAYRELPILIHPRVSRKQAETLKQALLSLREDPQARTMLQQTGIPGFETARDHDYDNVRKVYRLIGE